MELIATNVSIEAQLLITDGWASYDDLSLMGYNHQVVIHRDNFVNPVPYIDIDGEEVKF